MYKNVVFKESNIKYTTKDLERTSNNAIKADKKAITAEVNRLAKM